MASLTIRDVRKSYGPVQVMPGIELAIQDGEFTFKWVPEPPI